MKKYRWQILFGISLVLVSAALYGLHFLIFRDSHHIFIYMQGDLAFVPIQVLMVTLIIEAILSRREKKITSRNLDMVIGVFYHELGARLLVQLQACMTDAREFRRLLEPASMEQWDEMQFKKMKTEIEMVPSDFACLGKDLTDLKEFLDGKRSLLLNLLENPNLAGHDLFANMLWAITHISDELKLRPNIANLHPEDAGHISGDVRRAYGLLLTGWFDYVLHLKRVYPYMYRAALQFGPFGEDAQ